MCKELDLGTGKKFDVLLVIALDEEALVFHGTDFFPLSASKTLEAFRYHDFSFIDLEDAPRRGLIAIVGDVGSKIRDAVILFANRFRPKIVLSVGISGRVGSDAKVGDIVVPSHLYNYDYRSSTQDSETGGHNLIAGGKPVNVSAAALNICRSHEFWQKLGLNSLDNYCKSYKVDISLHDSSKIQHWIENKLLATVPRIIAAPFATGTSVNKSINFKNYVLLKIDRNIIAVDMESGLVGDAVQSLATPHSFFLSAQ